VQIERRMLIDGNLVDASTGATFSNVNPATEETIAEVADASTEDAGRAITAARRAFDDGEWSSDHKLRRRCLEQLQSALEEHREDVRELVVAEAGSPIALTYMVQVDYPIEWLSYFAELADSFDYERPLPMIEFMGQPNRGVELREPAGVVTAISPFNFPLYLNLAKLAPALAAGCTAVLKPSPETPHTATLLGRLIAEKTDFPPGVVNVITASAGSEAPPVLVTDPRVDVVSFTGSTTTGRKVLEACAPTVKRALLELGGKSANVILDDADMMIASALAIGYVCAHSGQACGLYTRLLLPASRYDEGVGVLKSLFENAPYGDPMNPEVLHGPLINETQRQRVLSYVERGVAEGATLAVGGRVPAHLTRGFYVEPTLFTDVDPDSTIAQEEIFGPVLAVIRYEDDEDAVRIANNSIYGLTGSVWSASEDRAMEIARRIRTGAVSINGGQWLHVSRPFGGVKQSGIGRENGQRGFEEYLESKVVALPG
jgi:aldehyde dehydrogenase (NAD+)